MAIYDFEDIVYPYDPANAKIENSWYFSNLAQYADTEYNLVLKPQSGSNLLEKSNDIYGWINNNGYGCCYAFKLKNHYRISKVTADVRAISYTANVKVAISLQPIYLESPSTYIQATDYYAQRDNGAAEVAQNRTTHITDDDWHTVEFPTYNLEIATHLNIYCPVLRSVEVKNIKIEGYKIIESPSGGAGSGYIGNSLVSNKKMVGYNVPTSSAEGTKTESVEVYDSNYVANKPKSGNGHCRIKFLREPGRKVQTLIDSSQGIKDSIFDNIVTIPNNDYGNDTWQFDQNGVLFINEKNSNRASINAKFLKGNATKLYIETSYEHRNTYGSNYRWQFVFLDNLYEGQHTPPSFLARTYFALHTNQYNIIDNDPWYDLPSTVIELSLNDIPANQRFYISFTSCDGHTEITKMYFDDEVYIVD